MTEQTPSPISSGNAYIDLTIGLVSEYVKNNTVSTGDFQRVISDTFTTISGLGGPAVPAPVEYQPAVSVKKSITHDALISMIDGKPYKTLKRHLAKHGLTPEAYRQRYNLPENYPIVAAAYSEQRAALATAMGLGRDRRKPADPAPAPSKSAGKKSGGGAKKPAKSAAKTKTVEDEQAPPAQEGGAPADTAGSDLV